MLCCALLWCTSAPVPLVLPSPAPPFPLLFASLRPCGITSAGRIARLHHLCCLFLISAWMEMPEDAIRHCFQTHDPSITGSAGMLRHGDAQHWPLYHWAHIPVNLFVDI